MHDEAPPLSEAERLRQAEIDAEDLASLPMRIERALQGDGGESYAMAVLLWATLAERRLADGTLQVRAAAMARQARHLLGEIELGYAEAFVAALLEPNER